MPEVLPSADWVDIFSGVICQLCPCCNHTKHPRFSRLKTWGDRAKFGLLAIPQSKSQGCTISRAVTTIPSGADSSMPTFSSLPARGFWAITCLRIATIIPLIVVIQTACAPYVRQAGSKTVQWQRQCVAVVVQAAVLLLDWL